MASLSFCAHWFIRSWFRLCTTNWYWLADARAPTERFCTGFMKVLMPGMAPSWRRRSASTFCKGGRSAFGFSSTNSRPAFIAPEPPAEPTELATWAT